MLKLSTTVRKRRKNDDFELQERVLITGLVFGIQAQPFVCRHVKVGLAADPECCPALSQSDHQQFDGDTGI